jgi:hypothetical protein
MYVHAHVHNPKKDCDERTQQSAKPRQVAAPDLALINVSANELCSRPLAVINQTNYGNPWECSSLI